MRKYLHLKLNTYEREELILFDGFNLVVEQRYSPKGIKPASVSWVLVGGIAEKYKSETSKYGKIPISCVENVPPELKNPISDFLHEKGFNGPVEFYE